MAKAYKCSNCGEELVLGESLFGRRFKIFCPKCKKMAIFNSKEAKINEDAEKLKDFLFIIIDEHKAACRKHPKFCDEIIPPGFDFDKEEKRWKKWNDEATTHYACDLFNEEFYEALNAYQQGRLEDSLQELAQCGAVILRIMETIEKEMEK